MAQRPSAAARHAAEERLKAAHPEEYARLYAEEAAARGVRVTGPHSETKKRRAERLRAQLAELEEPDA